MSRYADAHDHRRKASEAMVKAQFYLLTGITTENRADALLYTALALYHVAASDPDETALAKAEEAIQQMQAKAAG